MILHSKTSIYAEYDEVMCGVDSHLLSLDTLNWSSIHICRKQSGGLQDCSELPCLQENLFAKVHALQSLGL